MKFPQFVKEFRNENKDLGMSFAECMKSDDVKRAFKELCGCPRIEQKDGNVNVILQFGNTEDDAQTGSPDRGQAPRPGMVRQGIPQRKPQQIPPMYSPPPPPPDRQPLPRQLPQPFGKEDDSKRIKDEDTLQSDYRGDIEAKEEESVPTIRSEPTIKSEMPPDSTAVQGVRSGSSTVPSMMWHDNLPDTDDEYFSDDDSADLRRRWEALDTPMTPLERLRYERDQAADLNRQFRDLPDLPPYEQPGYVVDEDEAPMPPSEPASARDDIDDRTKATEARPGFANWAAWQPTKEELKEGRDLTRLPSEWRNYGDLVGAESAKTLPIPAQDAFVDMVENKDTTPATPDDFDKLTLKDIGFKSPYTDLSSMNMPAADLRAPVELLSRFSESATGAAKELYNSDVINAARQYVSDIRAVPSDVGALDIFGDPNAPATTPMTGEEWRATLSEGDEQVLQSLYDNFPFAKASDPSRMGEVANAIRDGATWENVQKLALTYGAYQASVYAGYKVIDAYLTWASNIYGFQGESFADIMSDPQQASQIVDWAFRVGGGYLGGYSDWLIENGIYYTLIRQGMSPDLAKSIASRTGRAAGGWEVAAMGFNRLPEGVQYAASKMMGGAAAATGTIVANAVKDGVVGAPSLAAGLWTMGTSVSPMVWGVAAMAYVINDLHDMAQPKNAPRRDESTESKGSGLLGGMMQGQVLNCCPSVRGGALKASDLRKLLSSSYTGEPVDNWRMEKSMSTKNSKVYRNPSTGQVVVAHKGTQGATDWGNNLVYAVTGEMGYKQTRRFKEAQKVQKAAQNAFGKDMVSTIGHSQGGLQAQMLGGDSKEIITVNKATRPGEAVYGSSKKRNQTDVRTSIDPVSAFRSPFASKKKQVTIDADTTDPVDAHSYKHLDKLGDTMIGEGVGDSKIAALESDFKRRLWDGKFNVPGEWDDKLKTWINVKAYRSALARMEPQRKKELKLLQARLDKDRDAQAKIAIKQKKAQMGRFK